MTTTYKITITVTNEADGHGDVQMSNNIDGMPTAKFGVFCDSLRRQVASALEGQVCVATEISHLYERASNCTCNEDDDDA